MAEKEYIEREAARDMMEQALVDEWEIQYADDRLDEIPTVDAVEVVRCRECKWWRGPIYGNRCSYHSGPNHTEFYDADEFCSRGERKGGDE